MPVGQRDEHRVGEGHGELIGERAAPQPAGQAHPVHRGRGHARAAAGPPGAAVRAGAAVDLERDDHAVAGLDRAHALADREDLGYAFVAEVQRQRELRARRARSRSRGRRSSRRSDARSPRPAPAARATARRASAGVAPGATCSAAHPRSGAPDALAGAVADRRPEPAQPLRAVALEQHRHRRRGIRREEARVVAQPAARAGAGRAAHRTNTIRLST